MEGYYTQDFNLKVAIVMVNNATFVDDLSPMDLDFGENQYKEQLSYTIDLKVIGVCN